jgi:tryptophan halogenase
MEIPESLTERLELFRSSGRFFKHWAQELFAEESWVQVLIGQGFEMNPDPVTQFVPTEEISGFLSDIAEVIAETAATMPDHADFIAELLAGVAERASAAPAAIMASTVKFTLESARR